MKNIKKIKNRFPARVEILLDKYIIREKYKILER